MNRLTLAIAAAVLVPAASAPLWAQQVIPVRFPAGSTGTTFNGHIQGRQFKDYRIGLRAGQMLSVNMNTLRGNPYFNVMEPGQTSVAIFVGSTSGSQMEVRTSKTGNYTIRVYQMRNDERRGAAADYRMTISARGGGMGMGHPNAPSHHPGDALVAGTPYHAVAPIRCRVNASGRWGDCKAGVIRRPGSATVHIDTLDGGERTILFRDGRAVSSDAGGAFRVMRRGDTSVISIGQYETYEIPDALPMGG